MRNKRLFVVAVVLLTITLSRLVMSPAIAEIRSVDLVTIFVAGFAAGAITVALVNQRRQQHS